MQTLLKFKKETILTNPKEVLAVLKGLEEVIAFIDVKIKGIKRVIKIAQTYSTKIDVRERRFDYGSITEWGFDYGDGDPYFIPYRNIESIEVLIANK
jgi:hypothetical protein